MTIYVDNPHDYNDKYIGWCHMATDNPDITELHQFASKINLSRSWFQEHTKVPHYDLSSGKRKLAVQNGAIEVSSIELFKKCRR